MRPSKKPLITPRRAGMAGIIGVFLFAATVVFLTVVEYEFMVSAGWRPLTDPGSGWPSGLALGEYGWMMNVSFVVSGMLLVVFAVGLRRGLGGGFGGVLLIVAGVAMAMMAFETDPILREEARSWHGWIHDVSFIAFALSMLASMFFLSRKFGEISKWKHHARYTFATGMISIVCLVLPNVAYYFFIVVLLAWILVTAMELLDHRCGSSSAMKVEPSSSEKSRRAG